jgi:hypothetical protein
MSTPLTSPCKQMGAKFEERFGRALPDALIPDDAGGTTVARCVIPPVAGLSLVATG